MSKVKKEFDAADFYSHDDGGGGLSHEDVPEALEEALDDLYEKGDSSLHATIDRVAPVEILAWERKEVDDRWYELQGEYFAEKHVEDWAEELGDPEGGDWDDGEEKALGAKIAEVLKAHGKKPWQCEVFAKREYSAEELKAMFPEGEP